MAQISNAIYAGGVLKPNGPLNLRENQRVRVIIEPIDEQPVDRSVALTRLRRESPQCTSSPTGACPHDPNCTIALDTNARVGHLRPIGSRASVPAAGSPARRSSRQSVSVRLCRREKSPDMVVDRGITVPVNGSNRELPRFAATPRTESRQCARGGPRGALAIQ